MKQNYTIQYDLLVKYLLNETNDTESREVERWIQTSPANRKYFEQLLFVWEQSLSLAPAKTINRDDAWLRLQERMKKGENTVSSKPFTLLSVKKYRIAATVITVLFAGLLYILLTQNKPAGTATVQVSSVDKVLTDTLPDGSAITVNRNSTLTYPSRFSGKAREVTLRGEAFFKVTPDRSRPFIIHVNDVTVRVVGTSFNIKSNNGKTEVIVETGIVQVTRNRQSIRLLPKQKVIALRQDSAMARDTVRDELYNYYRSKTFVCNNTPLFNLVETLNEAYHANIIIGNEALKDLPITTVFKEEPLDNILAVIRETFNIQTQRSKDTIILR